VVRPHPAVFLSTCLPDHPPAEKTETKVQHDYPETPAANLLRFKSESDDSGCSSLSFSQCSSPDECTIYRFTHVWRLIHSFILNCHKEMVILWLLDY